MLERLGFGPRRLHLRLPRRPVSLVGNVSPLEREHGVFANNDPIDDETIAPFADRMGAGAKPRRHDGVAVLTRSRQHDLRPQRQCRRQRARYGQKMRTFVARHRECRPRASGSRQVSPSIRVPETNAINMLRTYGASPIEIQYE